MSPLIDVKKTFWINGIAVPERTLNGVATKLTVTSYAKHCFVFYLLFFTFSIMCFPPFCANFVLIKSNLMYVLPGFVD